MTPQNIDDMNVFSNESSICSDIANKELLELIDKHMLPSDRAVYIKLKHGQKIPSAELNKLKETILNIIANYQ
jgi:septum formation topological specificity factor MinE